MTGKTHLVGGYCAAMALLAAAPMIPGLEQLSVGEQLLGIPLAMAGAIIPDMDTPTSKLGQHHPIVSKSLISIVGHRTMLHSLTFWGAILGFAYWAMIGFRPLILFAAVGILSHILLDMLNKQGVALLWPLPKKFSVASVPLNGAGEMAICIALLVLSIRPCAEWVLHLVQ